MNKRNRPALILVSLLLIPMIRADSPAASPAAAKAAENDPLAGLTQGVPAEAVKKILGAPNQVKPMKAPNGKAEVWIYEHELSRRVDRIDNSTPDIVINVTQPDGSVKPQVTPGQVGYQYVHYVTVERTEVLMFNDHYLMRKVARQERRL